MKRLSNQKSKREKKPYDKANLLTAYEATLSGLSVYRVSRMYGVPESTLRDRTRQNVSLDCRPGPARIFTNQEEKALVDHIVYMANIGYGYSITDLQYMAANYARSLGKNVKAREGLSQGWFYGFVQRWEQLKVASPQKLGMARAKCTSQEVIDAYFKELGSILHDHDLMNAPERIFNIDESGFSTEHVPPKIVCEKNSTPQSVTSPRTKNITIIGGANAMGNYIPPFYIFPGKRWCDNLLEGAPTGSVGHMSESGWVNRGLFETYVTTHFKKYSGVVKDSTKPTTLLLYDGHKSHISLTLTNWAKEHNTILFVLPPHSSHLTQPLDVGVFGPMKRYFHQECKSYLHSNPGIAITRYEIARLTAKPYTKAFCPENVVSAFKKAGIHPFDRAVITQTQTMPATIYPDKALDCPQDNSAEQVNVEKESNFLDDITITKVVLQRPKKKFVPPLKIVGNLLAAHNVDSIEVIEQNKKQNKPKTTKSAKIIPTEESPKPSTSGLSKQKGAPLNVSDSQSDSESDFIEEDNDPCCVCNKSFPPQLRGCMALNIVNWGQCDVCEHWVHLKHCSSVSFLRRGSAFRCMHCPEE